jgi:hypothetical protein
MKTAVLEKKNDFGSNFFTNVLTKERPHFMLHFHATIEILYMFRKDFLVIATGAKGRN